MKVYLGDSVYVDYDGFHFIMTTENGQGPSNIIYIERGVAIGLLKYIDNEFRIEYKNHTAPDPMDSTEVKEDETN